MLYESIKSNNLLLLKGRTLWGTCISYRRDSPELTHFAGPLLFHIHASVYPQSSRREILSLFAASREEYLP